MSWHQLHCRGRFSHFEFVRFRGNYSPDEQVRKCCLVPGDSLGAIEGGSAKSCIHAEATIASQDHAAQVITHISYLMQKMGRAGLQPDGVTYSVLHGMWLRLGNLPQAVGALAQAKQRAGQRSGDHAAVTRKTYDNALSSIGEPLWDRALRDDEIGRHIRSMADASNDEENVDERRVQHFRSTSGLEATDDSTQEQRQRAAKSQRLCVSRKDLSSRPSLT